MDITFLEAMELVRNYYDGTDAFAKLATNGYVVSDLSKLVNQVPGLTMTVSQSGKVLGYDYDIALANPPSSMPSVDSNIDIPTYGVDSGHATIPSNTSINSGTGKVDMSSGVKKVGTGTTVASVAKSTAQALVAASLGIKLGKTISPIIYQANPDFWDTVLPGAEWDSSKWGDVILDNSEDYPLFRTIFGIEPSTQSATMYVPESLLAFTLKGLIDKGAYNGREEIIVQPVMPFTIDYVSMPVSYITGQFEVYGYYQGQIWLSKQIIPSPDSKMFVLAETTNISSTNAITYFNVFIYNENNTENAVVGQEILYEPDGTESSRRNLTAYNLVTYNSSGYYFHVGQYSLYAMPDQYFFSVDSYNDVTGLNRNGYKSDGEKITWLLGEGSTQSSGGIEGLDDNTNVPVLVDPSIIDTTSATTTLNDLRTNYPSLFDGAIYEDVVQPDGTVNRQTYIPVPIPSINENGQIESNTSEQGHESVSPSTGTQPVLDMITDVLVQEGEPPETGSGDSPAIVVPIGTASSLWKIYNPTESELNSFASWLWTDNLIEQFKKLFNSPMDAVIGVHKVFASPSVGGRANIKCGYLDSGVSSNYINSQYTTIDCGTVSLREYFGNVFDYSPYTEISLFLPFIGIVKLDNADVMRADISVKYSVDVLTGACLAEVNVTRDMAGGNLYVYSGSAIVQYPLTSGSYAGAIAGVLSIAGGVAGTLLSGGSMLPATVGVINGVSRLRADVQKSGGFSGCAGAMGCKIPYLIVSRPQTAMAENFQHYTGLPANSLVTLSACSGRTRVKSIHVENINKATNEEKDMIERILKSGVTI